MEIGIDSFASAKWDEAKGASVNSVQALEELLERIEHADKCI